MQARMCKWKSCRKEIAKTHLEKAKLSLPLPKHQVMKTNGGVGVNNQPFDSRWI